MKVENNRVYSLYETSRILGVSASTLRCWDKSKYFVAGRTKGGHRRYTGQQINEIYEKMFKDKQ